MLKSTLLLSVALAGSLHVNGQKAPAPLAPLPTPAQVEQMKMETYAFIHFTTNTFLNLEWGYGDAAPSVFNPDTLDCGQWVKTLLQGGLKGIIFTAKHHDGFCLWPTKYTDYSISASPYRHGKGDAVGELAAECRKQGMEFGVYLSPWDRHQASYGTPEYVDYYKKQLRELLTQYGPFFEVWFDGANGGDGYYGGAREKRTIDKIHYYNFPALFKMLNDANPNCIIHTDGGPGSRWIGNENGVAGETDWAFLTDKHMIPAGVEDHERVLGQGDADGSHWVHGEADVSIRRPNWFWSTTNDNLVLSPEQLVDLYFKSVGRNATLLLNVPVNIHGKIAKKDSLALVGYREIIDKTFAVNLLTKAKVTASTTRGKAFRPANVVDGKYDSYWATGDGVNKGSLTFRLRQPQTFNCLMLQEYIPLGQRVKRFSVEYLDRSGKWQTINAGQTTTVGYKRLLRFHPVSTSQVRVKFLDARGPLCINAVGAYRLPINKN